MATTFSDVVEKVQELDLDSKMEMQNLLGHWINEERRAEILRNAEEGRREHAAGKLQSYDNIEDLMKALNAD